MIVGTSYRALDAILNRRLFLSQNCQRLFLCVSDMLPFKGFRPKTNLSVPISDFDLCLFRTGGESLKKLQRHSELFAGRVFNASTLLPHRLPHDLNACFY